MGSVVLPGARVPPMVTTLPDFTTSSRDLNPEAAMRPQATESDVGVPMYSNSAGSIRTFLSPMALAKISAGLHTPRVLPSGLARL